MADPTKDSSYAGAVEHYLSPRRKDAVKRFWEEPATRRLLTRAVATMGRSGQPRVLDVGCGAGDGLALLLSLPEAQQWRVSSGVLRYVGLDLNEELIDVASTLYADLPGAEFLMGDIRTTELPDEPFDIYLSTGVPYSHLTKDELEEVLASIFDSARRHSTRSVVVVDVLGRYSIEWVDNWHSERWPYRMSFFQSDADSGFTDMSFYSAESLSRVISKAATSAGCSVPRIEFADRSIMVGRHTATTEYDDRLPPYRKLVNDLYNDTIDVPIEELRFAVELDKDAPPQSLEFFDSFSSTWNTLLDNTIALKDLPSASVGQPMLADGLRHLEANLQSGLGVGHSLTALAYVQP